MSVWVVRAGRVGEFEDLVLREGIVAIDFDFRRSIEDFAVRNDLLDHLRSEPRYRDSSNRKVAKPASQLWRFANEIHDGDMVVLPRKSPRVVAVGRVHGGYSYRPGQKDAPPHTRSVKWLVNDISRDSFDQDIRYSLGGLATVYKIRATDAESRIEQAVEVFGAGGPATEVVADEAFLIADDDSPAVDLEEQIQDRIVQRIRQEFSGTRLEYLLKSILQAHGYHAVQTQAGPDGGIDVVAGMGDMGFGEPRLCVQVKSGKAPVGLPEYNRLQGNIHNFGAQHGLLVSLSDITSIVRKQNEISFFQIRLWGPDELVRRLLETYDSLPADIRADIPLQSRRVLVESED